MKTLIQSANVWNGTDFEVNSVVIEDKMIRSVGQAPGETVFDTVIDGAGKYLLPGVIDCHAHSTMVCGTRHMADFFAASDSALTINSVVNAEKMARCGITSIRDETKNNRILVLQECIKIGGRRLQ